MTMSADQFTAAAASYADALDAARDRDDDQPGDETTRVDAATFGLHATAVSETKVLIRTSHGQPYRGTLVVAWSTSNYFWHVAGYADPAPQLDDSPGPCFTRHHRGPGRRDTYTDVRCADCRTPLQPVLADPETTEWEALQAGHALHLQLSGGYGEFIDNVDPDDRLHVLLCETCAKKLLDTFGYLKAALFTHVNLNIGHTCLDGANTWVPQPECGTDPDRHGWRPVWAVTEPAAGAHRIAYLHAADTEAHANQWLAANPGAGRVIHECLTGNLIGINRPDGTPLLPR